MGRHVNDEIFPTCHNTTNSQTVPAYSRILTEKQAHFCLVDNEFPPVCREVPSVGVPLGQAELTPIPPTNSAASIGSRTESDIIDTATVTPI